VDGYPRSRQHPHRTIRLGPKLGHKVTTTLLGITSCNVGPEPRVAAPVWSGWLTGGVRVAECAPAADVVPATTSGTLSVRVVPGPGDR
jgi:hypothetical protein